MCTISSSESSACRSERDSPRPLIDNGISFCELWVEVMRAGSGEDGLEGKDVMEGVMVVPLATLVACTGEHLQESQLRKTKRESH